MSSLRAVDGVGAHTVSLMMVLRLLLGLQIEVVYHNICSKCDDSDSEAGEHARYHCTVGEYRVLAPGLTFGPGITKERRWVRHLIFSNQCSQNVLYDSC